MEQKKKEDEVMNEEIEKIIQKILTDGEQSLSASDFEYYCVCLPEILKMIKAV